MRVVGSGRTDSGVHALGQVASLPLENWSGDNEAFCRALNVHLPPTILVKKVANAPDGFHAIRDCLRKRYRYQLQVRGPRDPFEYRFRWHLFYRMNFDIARQACSRFVGEHDFKSFQAVGSPRKSTIRHVNFCDIVEMIELPSGGVLLAIEIEADGFLYNMVRNIIGTVVEVARGRQSPQWIDKVFEATDRNQAAQTAPAHGLFLKSVTY